jgi:NADH dehydrogenase/NADH:ubiquinone oxidoreductase subunit G
MPKPVVSCRTNVMDGMEVENTINDPSCSMPARAWWNSY